MKLPASAHADRRWRIHEITADFQILDVWALPTPGGPDDFPRLVEVLSHFDAGRDSGSAIVRGLFALRFKLGELLKLDDDAQGLGARVPTLADRLPEDLRGTAPPRPPGMPFAPLYLTDDEVALEIANKTVHGVMHVGWVQSDGDSGEYRGQMAVLVKRNGALGAAYMAAIEPFRHLIVYPQLMRDIERAWTAPPGGR